MTDGEKNKTCRTELLIAKDAAHTPGPWEAVATVSSHRKHIFGTGKNREYYVGTIISGSLEGLAVFKANVRLIAAAPELLQALEWQEMAESDPEAGRHKGYFDRAREVRRAAIRKARGRNEPGNSTL